MDGEDFQMVAQRLEQTDSLGVVDVDGMGYVGATFVGPTMTAISGPHPWRE